MEEGIFIIEAAGFTASNCNARCGKRAYLPKQLFRSLIHADSILAFFDASSSIILCCNDGYQSIFNLLGHYFGVIARNAFAENKARTADARSNPDGLTLGASLYQY